MTGIARKKANKALDPLDIPAGGAWITAARQVAANRLAAFGPPGRRDEYWRFTDPARLNAATPAPVAPISDAAEPAAFDTIERARIVFVDGHFDAAESDTDFGPGVTLTRLAEAAKADIHGAAALYGTLEAAGHDPVARPFAARNTALAEDGVLITVTAKASRPLEIEYRHRDPAADVTLHHAIRLEAGASLTLLESGAGAARLSTVAEVDLGKGARFDHIRLQGRDHGRVAATHLFARVAEGAAFKSFTLTANGALTRNEAVIDIVGADAVAHIAGAAMGDKDFHHDDTVFIAHRAPGCESRQVFKKVLRNGAIGAFQGKILVDAQAQKTDGYQISQALLLDGDSQFLAKPELEIYADDVRCSHGSTSGAVDAEALFYLTSRGVPRAAAQDMLVVAFLAEAMAEIADPAIAEDIEGRLIRWLARHRRAG